MESCKSKYTLHNKTSTLSSGKRGGAENDSEHRPNQSQILPHVPHAVNPSSCSNSVWAQASSMTIHSGMMTEVHRLTLVSAAAGVAFSRS